MPDHVIAVDVVVLEPPAVIEVFNVGVQGPPGPQGPPGEGGEGGGTLTAHAATHEPGGTDPLVVNAAAATGSLRTLGTTATAACAGNDARLSNPRTPTTHAATHQPGGSDALAVDAAAATGSLRTLGTGATQAAPGNDARFTAPSTPTAHAATHAVGQSDPVTVTALAGYPGGTANFLRADGTFAPPPAGGGGGDVTGPASAVDNRLALFNGTTGKLLDAGPDGTISGSLAIGTNPAQSGVVRIGNGQIVKGRTADNTADVSLLSVNAANEVSVSPDHWCRIPYLICSYALDFTGNGIVFTEAVPGVPAANQVMVGLRDNGAGKSELVARFPNGDVVIATQP